MLVQDPDDPDQHLTERLMRVSASAFLSYVQASLNSVTLCFASCFQAAQLHSIDSAMLRNEPQTRSVTHPDICVYVVELVSEDLVPALEKQ